MAIHFTKSLVVNRHVNKKNFKRFGSLIFGLSEEKECILV